MKSVSGNNHSNFEINVTTIFKYLHISSHSFYKRVSQSCEKACEHRTKARLSFSGGPHAPVNMADGIEEVNKFVLLISRCVITVEPAVQRFPCESA